MPPMGQGGPPPVFQQPGMMPVAPGMPGMGMQPGMPGMPPIGTPMVPGMVMPGARAAPSALRWLTNDFDGAGLAVPSAMPPFGAPYGMQFPSPLLAGAPVARPPPPQAVVAPASVTFVAGTDTSMPDDRPTTVLVNAPQNVDDAFLNSLLRVCGRVRYWKRMLDAAGRPKRTPRESTRIPSLTRSSQHLDLSSMKTGALLRGP